MSMLMPELVGKQLQLLKVAIPGMSRVAVLSNPTVPTNALLLKEAKRRERPAALLLLGAAFDSYAIVRLMAQRGYFVAAFLLIPAFHITVAAYIFFSKDVRAFFEKRAFVSPYAP